MILHDQHVHSCFSHDSKELIDNYYNKTKELGCKYFITTEHIDFDVHPNHEDWTADFEKLKKRLSELYKSGGPIPLLGVEIGYRADFRPKMEKWINSQDFDVINLSIHNNPLMEYYYESFFREYGIDKCLEMYFNQMMDAMLSMDDFDVLAHIDYGFKTAYNIDKDLKFSDYEHYLIPILKQLIKKDKALEINTKVQKAFPDTHLKYLLGLYKSLQGTKLTLSSDAHIIDRYMEGFDKYKQIIKDCGFDHLCYFVKRKCYNFDI